MYYYMNKNSQSNGDYEVHTAECAHLPKPENQLYLGNFDNCRDALAKARKYEWEADGCAYCCKPCHTS
jgi:hypothetical protein